MKQQKLRDAVEKAVKIPLPKRVRYLLSARLVWAFAVFLAAAWLFAWIAKEVRDTDTMAFDRWMLWHIHSLAVPPLDTLVRGVTQLGGVVFVPLITVVIFAYLFKKVSPEHAWLVLSGVIGSSLLNLFLKSVFMRSRPDLWSQIVSERSFSFPSGHAMASASLAASMVGVLWFSRWRKTAISLGMLYITVVGFTRLYLGVHYPTDIVAGWVIAIGWVALVWIIFADAPKTKASIQDPKAVSAPKK